MSGICIVSRNEAGANAIRRHLKDKREESLKNRLLYRQMYKETVGEEPLSLTISARLHKDLFGAAAIEPVAVAMMNENGATPDDYYIEVEE